MKKILNLSLILFVFCLTSLFSGFFICSFIPTSTTYAADNTVTISNATELKRYIDNYGGGVGSQYGQPTDNIVLSANIDMSTLNTVALPDGDIVTNTIGTESKPYTGTFDGRGYSISNLRINVSSGTTVNNQYAGLFGYTKGATIKNVSIAGNLTITTGGCITAYVGGVVGRAENTTIHHAQITARFIFNTDFYNNVNNVNFGTLVGMGIDSQFSYVICRYSSSSGFGTWNFSRKDSKVSTFGGVAGKISNCEISFAIAAVRFIATVSSEFVGDISIGGIVGNISQGGSKIVNAACENSFSVVNNASTSIYALVNVGEIAGVVSNPAPVSKNMSYIHFKANNGINRFGSIGNYAYTDQSNYDYITSTTDTMTSEAYFLNQLWHPLYETWNFERVWYVGSSTIYLQSFYGSFTVKISANLNKAVLSMTSTLDTNGYRFGDTVSMNFAFVGSMSDYYTLSSVALNGVEKAKIVTISSGSNVSYRISGTELLDITKNVNDNGFTLIIKETNRATAGEYNIITTAKNFKAQLGSKLFSGANADQLVEGATPGYVYYAEGTNTTTESLTLSKMVYGQTYRVETRVKPNTPNSFDGWYLAGESVDIKLGTGTNRILEFTFGTGNFVSDCEIYAKYKDNACIITFKIDDGVVRIDLYSGGVSISETGEIVAVSKEESSLKLEIYVSKKYDFDVQQFILDLDVYKTDDPTKTFCTLRESYENEQYIYYQLTLDMTTLKKDDFNDSFTINVQTVLRENNNKDWIWIAVGAGGGAFALGLIIFLIVFFVRRNRFGGGGRSGGGKSSFKKSSFKNQYY